jgi:cytosine/adenosine deaminase-related metal-dependent hydrolase
VIPEEEAHGEMEKLDGILMPGLINSHCHLELSHLKGVIPPGTGLVPFLISVVTKRGAYEELKKKKKYGGGKGTFSETALWRLPTSAIRLMPLP